jgi:hypothetical protein
MRIRTLAVPLATFLWLVATPALGASVTYTDQDDFERSPDVHATTKRSFLSESLGRRVRISVRGELGPRFRLRVLVDARGDDRADFVMEAVVANLELVSCEVRRLFGPEIASRCDGNIDRVWWGVARQDLRPDHRIRWRVVAFDGVKLRRERDRAPDEGWFA